MGEEQMGLEISVEDLKALAQINPLAWAQLLHIADVRILKAKIADLETENTRLTTRAVNLFQGHEKRGLSDDPTTGMALGTAQDAGIVP